MPDPNNYQPMYSDPVGNRRPAGAPIIGKQEKEKEPLPDFNSLPYPPQIRGHYTESDGRQYVSVLQHDGAQGWMPVGATLGTNWKIESIDQGKNQVKLSAFGIPVAIDIGHGVPTGNIDRPYKIVDSNNYTAEFQNFSESQHGHFFDSLRSLFDPARATTFEALRLQKLQKLRDKVINSGFAYNPTLNEFGEATETGSVSSNDQEILNQFATMDGYNISQSQMDNVKKNFEADGNSSDNVISYEEFQQRMLNGTAEPEKDYLVPRTDENGNTDFERFRYLPNYNPNQPTE